MELTYTYWKSGDWLLGYLNDYPDHWTQGKDREELEEMIKDLYELLIKVNAHSAWRQ
jgi:predicted RNase H-like HicB family nuclease